MIEAQTVSSETLTAILAAIFVSQENVATVKFDPITGKPVVSQQTNNSRNLNFKIYGSDPVRILTIIQFELQQADFQPVVEVIRMECPVVDGDNFRGSLVEQTERAGDGKNVDRQVMAIQRKNAGLNRRTVCCNHLACAPPHWTSNGRNMHHSGESRRTETDRRPSNRQPHLHSIHQGNPSATIHALVELRSSDEDDRQRLHAAVESLVSRGGIGISGRAHRV